MKIKSGTGFQFSLSSGPDASVDQHNQDSLDKWSLMLGVTKEELLLAIRDHGTLIKNIRKGLLKKKKDEAA